MSSAGRAASSSGCVAKPRGRETGLTGCAEPIQRSLPTGGSAMETAEHREPYESRGSRTDLGAPGGESPPGDSTIPAVAVDRTERLRWVVNDLDIACAQTQKSPLAGLPRGCGTRHSGKPPSVLLEPLLVTRGAKVTAAFEERLRLCERKGCRCRV